MPSNPAEREGTGLPIELAQGGGTDAHKECVTLLKNATLKDTLIALYLNTELILFTFQVDGSRWLTKAEKKI
jgi:hypothetical protein